MHRPAGRRRQASRRSGMGLCVSLFASIACGDASSAREQASDPSAEADREQLVEAAEQRARDRAIATIENDRGQPPRPFDAGELESVLSYYCGECHGDGNIALHFETVEDLVELNKIVPGDAAKSRVMIRILADDMPPPQVDLPAVSPATARLIAEFIDGLPPL